ncbi:unnamed protein product, partial [marine sediment metagenome]
KKGPVSVNGINASPTFFQVRVFPDNLHDNSVYFYGWKSNGGRLASGSSTLGTSGVKLKVEYRLDLAAFDTHGSAGVYEYIIIYTAY